MRLEFTGPGGDRSFTGDLRNHLTSLLHFKRIQKEKEKKQEVEGEENMV